MNDKRTNESPLLFIKDSLIGENVKRSLKTLADLRGVFHNCEAYEQMSPDTLLYEVTCHLPVEEGTPGGLYFVSDCSTTSCVFDFLLRCTPL